MFSLIKFLIKTIIIVVIGYFIFTSSTVKSILTQKGDIIDTTNNNAVTNAKDTGSNILISFKKILLGGENFELPKLDNIIQGMSSLPNIAQNINQPNTTNEQIAGDRIFFDATVNIIIDGDTIAVKSLENGEITRIRLKGVNTPEISGPYTKSQCMGKESSQELRRLIQGKKVTVISDSLTPTHDSYGRLLAYIYTEDEILANEEMIKNGYAYEYTYKDEKYEMQNLFRERQTEAQNNQIGLWDNSKCVISPIGA
jgi:endonuclease YncB( thermonuclease family)